MQDRFVSTHRLLDYWIKFGLIITNFLSHTSWVFKFILHNDPRVKHWYIHDQRNLKVIILESRKRIVFWVQCGHYKYILFFKQNFTVSSLHLIKICDVLHFKKVNLRDLDQQKIKCITIPNVLLYLFKLLQEVHAFFSLL